MKRKIAIIAAILSIFSAGTAFGGAVNGYYHNSPIVKVTSDGKELPASDVPAMIEDGRTLVPLSLLRQAKFQVTWDPDTYQVDVSKHDPLTDAQLAEIKKSVGIVYTHNSDNTWSQGTVFAIEGGKWLTAYHVVEQDGKIGDVRVDLNGQTYEHVPVLWYDKGKDIAQLQVPANVSGLKVQDSKWLAGEMTNAIGFPKGKWAVSSGYVTGYNGKQLYSNAIVDGGDSGGPLINWKGEVLAVNVGVLADGTTVSPLLSLFLQNLK